MVIILILPGQREEYKQRYHRFLKESQLNKYMHMRMFVHKYIASQEVRAVSDSQILCCIRRDYMKKGFLQTHYESSI